MATPIWEKSVAAAQKTAESFPPQARDLYGPTLDAVTMAAEKAAAAAFDPDRVARSVGHALIAGNPKTRYLVGRGIGFRAFLKMVLPDRLFDRLIIRHVGLQGNSR